MSDGVRRAVARGAVAASVLLAPGEAERRIGQRGVERARSHSRMRRTLRVKATSQGIHSSPLPSSYSTLQSYTHCAG